MKRFSRLIVLQAALLIAGEQKAKSCGYSMLHNAVDEGDLERVKALLKTGANPHTHTMIRSGLLHTAVSNFHNEILRFILKIPKTKSKEDDFTEENEMALCPDDAESLDDISDDQLSISLESDSAISPASDHSSLDSICSSPSFCDSLSPAFRLKKGKKVRFLRLPLKADKKKERQKNRFSFASPKVNKTDYSRRTPLHYAIEVENLEAIEILLSAGADINAITEDGWTPSHLALKSSNHMIFTTLMAYRPDIGIRDKKGLSLLHHAARMGKYRAIEKLIAMGADVNAVDTKEEAKRRFVTPLHLAVRKGCAKSVKRLLKAGAKINPRDAHGRLPSDYVNMNKLESLQVASYLRALETLIPIRHDLGSMNKEAASIGETKVTKPLHITGLIRLKQEAKAIEKTLAKIDLGSSPPKDLCRIRAECLDSQKHLKRRLRKLAPAAGPRRFRLSKSGL